MMLRLPFRTMLIAYEWLDCWKAGAFALQIVVVLREALRQLRARTFIYLSMFSVKMRRVGVQSLSHLFTVRRQQIAHAAAGISDNE